MTPRRTLVATAGLGVLAGLLGGCGQAQEANPGAFPSTAPLVVSTTPTGIGTTATPQRAPGGAGVPATPTTGEGDPVGPTTTVTTDAQSAAPDTTLAERTPEDYGDAAIAAWTRRDRAGLARYVSPSAAAKVSGEAPTGELLRAACEGDMCTYTSEDGQRVTLTFDLAKVEAGRTGGITGVKVG